MRAWVVFLVLWLVLLVLVLLLLVPLLSVSVHLKVRLERPYTWNRRASPQCDDNCKHRRVQG